MFSKFVVINFNVIDNKRLTHLIYRDLMEAKYRHFNLIHDFEVVIVILNKKKFLRRVGNVGCCSHNRIVTILMKYSFHSLLEKQTIHYNNMGESFYRARVFITRTTKNDRCRCQ